MGSPTTFLVIDDNPSDRLITIRELNKEFPDLRIHEVMDQKGFDRYLAEDHFDLVITDYELLWSDGITVLKRLKAEYPDIPVIMFTASGTQETAVEAMKSGAADYVVKSETNIPRVRFAARNALDRKRQLLIMKENDRLATIGRLTAGVAHEIYQPLENVRNALFLLEKVPEHSQRESILQSAKAELQLIEQITARTLGFYRETQTRVPVKVEQILDSVLAMFARRLSYENIKVEKQYSETVAVSAFPGEIRQVFTNLVMNSIDAMPSGGSIRVKIDQHSDDSGGKYVRTQFCDTGVGIAPEHQGRIFDALFTTKGEKGTGLGLWISDSIIRSYGGRIAVSSQVNAGHSGTCFTIDIPAETKST